MHVIDAALSRLSRFSANDTYQPTRLHVHQTGNSGDFQFFNNFFYMYKKKMLCQSKYIFLSFWKKRRKFKSVAFLLIENNNPRHF